MGRHLLKYSHQFIFLASTLFLLMMTISCGSSNSSSQPANAGSADFSVAVQPTSVSLTPGVPQTLTFSVTPSGGFAGDVTISVSSSSQHLTFSAASLTVSAEGTGSLTVTADTSLVNSSATISVNAVSGTLSHTAQLSAQVGKVLTLNFAPRIDIPSGGARPGSLAVADFNGDGKQDIAVSNQNSNTVSVFLGKGDGTFNAAVITSVSVSNNLGAIVAGDFNEDGKQDILVATVAGDQVSILLSGNGDGTFTPQTPISETYTFLRAVTADVNGDGHLDVVAGQNPGAAVFIGKGDGTFSQRVDLTGPGFGAFVIGVTAADFNKDGKLDVAAVSYDSYMHSWTGNGDGTFQSKQDASIIYTGPSALAHADFNQDGKEDLLIGFTNSASVMFGNGDGTFDTSSAHGIYAGDPSGTGVLLVAADMNLDGLPDAVVVNYSDGTLNILVNDGLGFNPLNLPTPITYSIAPNLADVQVADFNGDGIPDIVVVNDTTGNLSLFLSQPDSSGRSKRARK